MSAPIYRAERILRQLWLVSLKALVSHWPSSIKLCNSKSKNSKLFLNFPRNGSLLWKTKVEEVVSLVFLSYIADCESDLVLGSNSVLKFAWWVRELRVWNFGRKCNVRSGSNFGFSGFWPSFGLFPAALWSIFGLLWASAMFGVWSTSKKLKFVKFS